MPEDYQQIEEPFKEDKEVAELHRLQQKVEARIAELYREEEKRREELIKGSLCDNCAYRIVFEWATLPASDRKQVMDFLNFLLERAKREKEG